MIFLEPLVAEINLSPAQHSVEYSYMRNAHKHTYTLVRVCGRETISFHHMLSGQKLLIKLISNVRVIKTVRLWAYSLFATYSHVLGQCV